LVASRYARDVIEHLKADLDCGVEKSEPGLYVVRGMPMPVQIIDSTELDAEDNMWLRNLRKTADTKSLEEMVYAIQKRGKGAPLKAYAHVLFTAANPDAIGEVKKMATSKELFEIFRDVFGYDEEWEERVMKKGREEGRKEGRDEGQMKMAENLLVHGFNPVVIAESAGLALEKIQKIAASL
jgi:hypothetical protein